MMAATLGFSQIQLKTLEAMLAEINLAIASLTARVTALENA